MKTGLCSATCAYVAISAFVCPAQADICHPVGPEDGTRLASYLVQKYRIPAQNDFRLDHDEQTDGCYHKLSFRGKGPLGDFKYTVFVSPDLRYLSTDILDSYLDPEREEREHAATVMTELLAGEHASRGPQTAPLTLVLFSDFQCPYCKRMEALLAAEPLLRSADKIRFVFRHMPLAGHDWALQAAEAAACAAFQNEAGFWRLHDGLFERQQTIRKNNIVGTVHDLAAGIPDLDIRRFDECIQDEMSLGVVIRDRDLAARLGVRGAPGLFINGEPLLGVSNGSALHDALAGALDRIHGEPEKPGSEREATVKSGVAR